MANDALKIYVVSCSQNKVNNEYKTVKSAVSKQNKIPNIF